MRRRCKDDSISGGLKVDPTHRTTKLGHQMNGQLRQFLELAEPVKFQRFRRFQACIENMQTNRWIVRSKQLNEAGCVNLKSYTFRLARWTCDPVSCIATLFTDQASSMSPRVMRAASALILALRRMPRATPGIDLRIGFRTANQDGNWSWVDVGDLRA